MLGQHTVGSASSMAPARDNINKIDHESNYGNRYTRIKKNAGVVLIDNYTVQKWLWQNKSQIKIRHSYNVIPKQKHQVRAKQTI